jgi:hypothetical protein
MRESINFIEINKRHNVFYIVISYSGCGRSMKKIVGQVFESGIDTESL